MEVRECTIMQFGLCCVDRKPFLKVFEQKTGNLSGILGRFGGEPDTGQIKPHGRGWGRMRVTIST